MSIPGTFLRLFLQTGARLWDRFCLKDLWGGVLHECFPSFLVYEYIIFSREVCYLCYMEGDSGNLILSGQDLVICVSTEQ